MSYYTLFYVIFFSSIAHKEIRFLLPVIPFVFVTASELIVHKLVNRYPLLVSWLVKIYILAEVATLTVITLKINRASNIRLDLMDQVPDIHSFYSTDVYNTPVYSLMHRPHNPVKIYLPNKDC